MLTIQGHRQGRFCDGQSRREFLKIGALGIGGLTLADLLRAEAAAGISSSEKGLINIHLPGGPSHQDMFDLKPEAPTEFRGEFNPIATNVPGLDICEHLPQLAVMADKFAVVRSLVGSNSGHDNYQTQTGYNMKDLASIGGRPSIGSVVWKLQGARDGAPPFVSYNGGSPGYLGPTYTPFSPNGRGSALSNLTMERSLTADRLSDRVSLLEELDSLRREVDASGQMAAVDGFNRTALEVVTSGRVADALDTKREDPRLVERYGKNGMQLLTARRLIQAGVRVVTLNLAGWDTHSNNFKTLKDRNLPMVDQAISALLEDLDARGMLADVSVVMWGEFGRTPRVNKSAGRDHWPKLSMAFLAGGGMRGGQAIGSSNRYAEVAQSRPVHYQEVHATLYHNMGIDPRTTQFIDPAGRPQYLLEHNTPIAELV
jgi:hypothetical protein